MIRTHLHDLISTTQEYFYEEYRSQAIGNGGVPTLFENGDGVQSKAAFQLKMKQDEAALRKRFAEQVRLEETRFRQWEQKVLNFY